MRKHAKQIELEMLQYHVAALNGYVDTAAGKSAGNAQKDEEYVDY